MQCYAVAQALTRRSELRWLMALCKIFSLNREKSILAETLLSLLGAAIKIANQHTAHTHRPEVWSRGVALIPNELCDALFFSCNQVLDHCVAKFVVAGVIEGGEHGTVVYFKE